MAGSGVPVCGHTAQDCQPSASDGSCGFADLVYLEQFVDREEFEELALSHLDAVYRMAVQLARHPDEASDLVQETYLKALRVAERFEEQGGGIRPWLFKILHNVFYTRLTKSKHQPLAVEELHGAADEGPAPDEPSPAWNLESLQWEYVDERLKEAIDNLRPEYRTVLLLWGVEGLKYREIAQIEAIPIGTVMSRLHRARSILGNQLADLAEEMGRSGG
ncbi:MAG: sigma-70 family RNA polymerase sigma factor [Phycisphaerales bacterium]